jgi:pimeloyl-ACP methyl ester carboxylesterase
MDLPQAIAEAEGYVFFMHGWSGSHRIWEKLPIQLAGQHKRLVCFNLDVNGFGQSPFLNDTPTAKQCNPAGLMATVEQWLAAINLWPSSRTSPRPFYLFVGHSMSGAALFFKDVTHWKNETYGFYALAPALFSNDVQRQTFFKTVGVSIRLPSFSTVKDTLAPHFIDRLGTGASPQVKHEHLRIYNQTPFSVLAQTLYVLGATATFPFRNDWSRFRVALGHKDRIVRMDYLLDLLEQFSFRPTQIRLTLGDHYFFSYGDGSPSGHKHNQITVFNDLLNFCNQLTEEAKRR